jgi:hypothetical protein
VHFGNEPAFCEVLAAWLVPAGRLLQIADDRAGKRCWPTGEEHERAEKERERAAREALERRVAELEARATRER